MSQPIDSQPSSGGKTSRWILGERKTPRVAILGAPNRDRVRAELERVRPVIESTSEIVVEDLNFAHDFETTDQDLVIVLGGDGSILQAARQMGEKQTPVLGINCGRLGFLAALSPDDFINAWPTVCCGGFDVIDHLMLDARLIRGGKEIRKQLALNEVAILGGPPYTILDIDLYADGHLATRYRCDGLIIATPVGSTAHNLSAGGPILRRNLDAMVISPISPHTLTYRPLVDSGDTKLELEVTDPQSSTSVVADGRIIDSLQSGDRIKIQRAKNSFRMLSVPGQNDYRTLRDKLGWGGSVAPKVTP